MAFSLEQSTLAAALLGVTLHLGYFIRGEHHRSNFAILSSVVFGPPALCLYLYVIKGFPLLESVKIVGSVTGAFLGSLTTSILAYRAFFHPLKQYPGPTLARLSKWWQARKTLSEYRTFELLDELHAKYGPYVRTGPNEISVIDPEIVDAVYGPQSRCRKANWYDMSLPITSLHQLRDRTLHDKRRRGGWDKAFSIKSIRAYDTRVAGYADLLVQKLDAFVGRPTNVTDWFNFYSYDVMGSLGFGRSFDTLETGGSHQFIKLLQEGTELLKCVGCVSYFIHLFVRVPEAVNPIKRINRFSEMRVEERKSNKTAEPDILGHLIDSEPLFGNPLLDHSLLVGDSRLVIVAGSDTTSCALVFTFFHIAKDPSVAEKIRVELKENDITKDNFSIAALQNLPYLNGVMNEGLRLNPPVPGGVFRMTPPEGLRVGERVIPGDVNVLVPTYSLHRSPENYVDPAAFIPERWSSKPELILNRHTFMPFSLGVYGCIGKHLAMGEIRTVISKILMEYDVRLAPNETGKTLFEEQQDHFTLNPGRLELCFIRRGQLN